MSNKHFTLVGLKVVAPSGLQLSYADGEVLHVELAPIVRKHRSLSPLKEAKVFAKAKIGEWGASVIWNNNDALELAADNLRARAIEQAGGYSHEIIWNWMARHELTLDAAAEALGLSRRMLAYYRSGEKPLPRTVALACLGWEAEQRLAA
ncbi:MAG TPA: hypothetical protein VLJ57_18805 [Burkholderiaceae bacterium]|nr:hypothetical protein [Burkholderiaceae bacterium]